MHPIFYFILLFLGLGIVLLIAKLVAMLRAASGVTARDVSDLLAYVFVTGFAGGCGWLVLESENSRSLAPGFAVLAVATTVLAVSLAIRSRAGDSTAASRQVVDDANLERREEIGGSILRSMGQSPAAIDKARAVTAARWKKFPWPLLLLILFGLIGLGLGGMDLWQGIHCKNWPHTDGIITSSNIAKHRSPGRHPRDVWGANITYDYKVTGVSYTGTRVAFGMEESSTARAQSFVDRYPRGKSVAVFYSPRDPASAVLETGIRGGTWVWLGVGGVFLAFGIGGLTMRRQRLKLLESMNPA